MKFIATKDMSPVTDFLSDLEKENLPFAQAKALTAVAKLAQGAIRDEMKSVFHNPTNFTLNSTYLKTADYRKIRSGAGDYSEVRIKDDRATSGKNVPIQWLSAEIYSGARRLKGVENQLIKHGRMPSGHVLIPGRDMPLDVYGNVSRGELVKVVSDLQAQDDIYANTTPQSRARRRASRTRRASFYFSTYLGGYEDKRVKHLPPGIYQRVETGFGSAIRVAFIFASKATYRSLLKFHDIAQRTGERYYPGEFQIQMRDAIASYRAKRNRLVNA